MSTQLLAELRAAGPTAARGAKSLIRELRSLRADEARAHTVRHIAQQRASAEGQEGLAAFLEKRPAALGIGGLTAVLRQSRHER